MTRRFEFISGNSAKFWEIIPAGPEVTVRYGRLGTAGQVQTKTFAKPEEASRYVNKVIAEKIRKGYVERAAQ